MLGKPLLATQTPLTSGIKHSKSSKIPRLAKENVLAGSRKSSHERGEVRTILLEFFCTRGLGLKGGLCVGAAVKGDVENFLRCTTLLDAVPLGAIAMGALAGAFGALSGNGACIIPLPVSFLSTGCTVTVALPLLQVLVLRVRRELPAEGHSLKAPGCHCQTVRHLLHDRLDVVAILWVRAVVGDEFVILGLVSPRPRPRVCRQESRPGPRRSRRRWPPR